MSQTPSANEPAHDAVMPQRPKDRAELAGFPPDSGPEQRVMIVHPSLWRGKPFTSAALAATPVLVPLLARLLVFKEMTFGQIGITFLVLALLCWGFFGAEWLVFSFSRSMKVTNKRVIERRGLFSRRTIEVIHEHIRSVSVEQTVVQRIFNTGTISISSAANAGVEIQMKDLPQPYKIKEVIDLYRDNLN
jgi:hypothetical protein